MTEKEILLSGWDNTLNNQTIWDRIVIKDKAFYLELENESIFLSSFKNKDLPKSPYTLTTMGKLLTKLSTYANIMSRRPGTEEVTFYSLANQAHSSLGTKVFDEKMLKIGGKPIAWRRYEIEALIKERVKHYITEKKAFTFIDIGCGGGFDSLEIERMIQGAFNCLEKERWTAYELINIDIDKKWLNNNEKISKALFKKSQIIRKNCSVFDYLQSEATSKSFKYNENLMISCNGFAEFLNDDELETLYKGIYNLQKAFEGNITIILPFSNKNEQQEVTGKKIGFKYRAKEKAHMINMVRGIFDGCKIDVTEKYSQIVLKVVR